MASNQLTPAQKQERVLTVIGQPERFASLLPPDVNVEKFCAVIKRGLQQNPALMNADLPSLILSCQNAAQDGLLPDGREGALVMYGQKVQWQPMIGGLRKKLADVGFDIRADVVYENDEFDYDLGDDPRITHKAPKLGVDRGKVIGAYAIATGPDGSKYREVMDLKQLDAVAAVSRSGQGGPWAGPFRPEMYRKTVAKRLNKSLPLGTSDAAVRLQETLARDNERDFDLSKQAKPEPSAAAQAVQQAARSTVPPPADEPPEPAQDDIDDAEFSDADQDDQQETGNEHGRREKAPF